MAQGLHSLPKMGLWGDLWTTGSPTFKNLPVVGVPNTHDTNFYPGYIGSF